VLYDMLHNYMFRPFFRPSSGCVHLALRVTYLMTKYTTLMMNDHQSSILCHHGTLLSWLSGYNLKIAWKRAETCSCETYRTTQCNKFCCVLTASYTGLFISPSGNSELDCATTKTDTTERSISIGRESLEVFFCTRGLGVLAGSTARG